jgi:hypothetical protein
MHQKMQSTGVQALKMLGLSMFTGYIRYDKNDLIYLTVRYLENNIQNSVVTLAANVSPNYLANNAWLAGAG